MMMGRNKTYIMLFFNVSMVSNKIIVTQPASEDKINVYINTY